MTRAADGMLDLHSDPAYLAPGVPHVTILIPFWGPTPEDPKAPTFGRFDEYASRGQQFFRIAPLADCNVAIFPQGWERVVGDEAAEGRAAAFVAQANEAGKPSVVFFSSDSTEPVPIAATVFRTSLYRSRRRPHEFAQ